MTNEQITRWVGRIFILLVFVTITVTVFKTDGNKPLEKKDKAAASQAAAAAGRTDSKVVLLEPSELFKDGQLTEILDEASRKQGSLVVGILHCHVPGNPESEQIADSLNRVAKKYGSQVQVVRADIIAFPEVATAENVTQAPKVVMIIGTERVFEFQGLWPLPQIERKVDELLHGLKRVGKDWRPEVKGMQRAPGTSPPSSTNTVAP